MPPRLFRTRSPNSGPPRRVRSDVAVVAVFLVSGAAPLPAQQMATARIEENFRAEPNGTIVARVLPGSEIPVTRIRGGWVETELEGWVWARSLEVAEREGHDLVVSAVEGENLRARPQGTIRARLVSGALLDELGRRPGWIRVRRVGWIWLESVAMAEAAGAELRPARDEGEASAVTGGRDDERGTAPAVSPPDDASREEPEDAGQDALNDPLGSPPGPAAASSGTVPGVVRVPGAGLAVVGAPDGDTLAVAEPGSDLRLLAREGGWARVRVDGWVWLGTGFDPGADSAAVPAEVDLEAVMREPDRYRGRLVTWSLQFVSLERAERVRTDFYEGEAFLLTRPSGGVGRFVYVAVPPDRLDELEDLTPLDEVEVVGRIRAGASDLTGSPILDLVEIRGRERR